MTTEETLTWHLKLPGISAEQTHGPIASRDRIFSYGHEGLLSGGPLERSRRTGRWLLVSVSFHTDTIASRVRIFSWFTDHEKMDRLLGGDGRGDGHLRDMRRRRRRRRADPDILLSLLRWSACSPAIDGLCGQLSLACAHDWTAWASVYTSYRQ